MADYVRNLLLLLTLFKVCGVTQCADDNNDDDDDDATSEQTPATKAFTGTTAIPVHVRDANATESMDGGWIPTTEVYLLAEVQPPVAPEDVTETVDEILNSIKTKQALKPDAQTLHISNLKNFLTLASTQKPDWVEKLKKVILELSPITPSVREPVQVTDWLRYQVRLEVFMREYLLGETENWLHQASLDYPGSVQADSDLTKVFNYTIPLETDKIYETLIKEKCTTAKRVQELNMLGKISCPRFCSSMYYAAPGSVLTLTANLQNVSEFVVRIGHHVDDNSGLDTWQQYPNMRTIKRFKVLEGAAEHKFQMPVVFGGMVYIGEINSSITLKKVTFQLSGVVETPSFLYPEMSLVDWWEERRKHMAPWGDLISGQLIISYPKRVLDNIPDPEELLIQWERIIDGMNELSGTPYKTGREHIAFTRDLPNKGSKMHAGWPIMALEKVGETLTDVTQLWKDGPIMDSFLHALGHNQERHLRLLKFKDGESIVNELFVDYTKNIVNRITPLQKVRKEYKAENIVKIVGKYLDNGAKFEEFFSSGAAQLFYYDFVRNFGWNTIYKLGKVSRKVHYSGEQERVDALAVEFSEIQEENMVGYLKSFGIPVSKEVELKTGKFPDSGILAQQLVVMANEQIQALAAKNAKGKGRGLQKRIDVISTTTESPEGNEEDMDNDEGEEVSTTEMSTTEGPSSTSEASAADDEGSQLGRGFDIINPEEMEKRKALWKPNSTKNDLDQLLNDAPTVNDVGTVGELLVYGPETIVVLAGLNQNKRGYIPVVAASHYGKGRIVLLTKEDFLLKSLTKGYFDKFQVNCFMWAVQFDENKPEDFKPVVVKHPKSSSKIAQYLTETGYPAQYLQMGDIDFTKFNLVIIPFGLDLTAKFVNGLKPFIEGGGGLILAANSGTRSPEYIRTMAANEIAQIAGARYVYKDAYYTATHKVYNTSKDFLAFTHVNESAIALSEILDQLALPEPPVQDDTKMNTVLYILLLALETLNKTELPWVQELKQKYLRLKPLTPGNPIKYMYRNKTDTLEFRVQMDTLFMHHIFDENDNYRHPGSEYFPGTIPADSDLSRKFKSTLNLDRNNLYDILSQDTSCSDTLSYKKIVNSTKKSCNRWCPTEFYAPAGVKVTIKFLSEDVRGFEVFGGRFEDIVKREAWGKYPLIRYTKKFPGNFGEFNDPFGGPISIGYIMTSQGSSVVPYEISGVIETPHFFLGKTKMSDWKRIRKLPGPWGYFTCTQLEMKQPRKGFSIIENPEELMTAWERILDAAYEYHAMGYRIEKERFNFDLMLTKKSAFMISGHIQAFFSRATYAANYHNMWYGDGADSMISGFIHEIGHNLDLSWWKMAGTSENSNNWHIHYIQSTTMQRTKDRSQSWPYDMMLSLGRNLLNETFNPNPMTRYLNYDMYRIFGWNVLIKMAALSKGVKFRDDAFRADWILITLSKILKRNMASYLQSWRVYPSNDAIAKVSHFPESKYSAQQLEEMVTKQGVTMIAYKKLSVVSNDCLKIIEKEIKVGLKNITNMRTGTGKQVSEQVKQAIRQMINTVKNSTRNTASNSSNAIKDALGGAKSSIKFYSTTANEQIKRAVLDADDVKKNCTDQINAAVKKATADRKEAEKNGQEKKKSASKLPKEEADKIVTAAAEETQRVKKQSAGEVAYVLEKATQESEAVIKKALATVVEVVKQATQDVTRISKKSQELMTATANQATDTLVTTTRKAIEDGLAISRDDAKKAVSNMAEFLNLTNDALNLTLYNTVTVFDKAKEDVQNKSHVMETSLNRPIHMCLWIAKQAKDVVRNGEAMVANIKGKVKNATNDFVKLYEKFANETSTNLESAWAKPINDMRALKAKIVKETDSVCGKSIKEVKDYEKKVTDALSNEMNKAIGHINGESKKVAQAVEKARPLTIL